MKLRSLTILCIILLLFISCKSNAENPLPDQDRREEIAKAASSVLEKIPSSSLWPERFGKEASFAVLRIQQILKRLTHAPQLDEDEYHSLMRDMKSMVLATHLGLEILGSADSEIGRCIKRCKEKWGDCILQACGPDMGGIDWDNPTENPDYLEDGCDLECNIVWLECFIGCPSP